MWTWGVKPIETNLTQFSLKIPLPPPLPSHNYTALSMHPLNGHLLTLDHGILPFSSVSFVTLTKGFFFGACFLDNQEE